MSKKFTCSIKSIRFDENYHPSESTRLTTNFANLARGESRQENLRKTLQMINNRFNDLAHWDNPKADRYSVEIDIISANMDIEGNGHAFPVIEMLKTTIVDHQTNKRIDGMVGNSFSSYVRDYDFSVLLLEHSKNQAKFSVFEKEEQSNVFTTKYYDKSGKLLHENKYNETRQPIGIQKNFSLRNDEAYANSETHYDANGKQTKHIYNFGSNSSTETNYRNGVPHGEKITTNKDNVKTIEYYYESKGNSKKVTKEEFENLVKAEKK